MFNDEVSAMICTPEDCIYNLSLNLVYIKTKIQNVRKYLKMNYSQFMNERVRIYDENKIINLVD